MPSLYVGAWVFELTGSLSEIFLITWCKEQHLLHCLDLPITRGVLWARTETALCAPVISASSSFFLRYALADSSRSPPEDDWTDTVLTSLALCILLFQWTSRHTCFKTFYFGYVQTQGRNRENTIKPLSTCSSPDRSGFQGCHQWSLFCMVRMKATALAPALTLCSFLFLYSWFGDCALYLGHLILTVGATAPVQGLTKILSLAPSCTVQIEVISVGAHERGTSSYLLACMCAKSLQSCPILYDPMDCSPPDSCSRDFPG